MSIEAERQAGTATPTETTEFSQAAGPSSFHPKIESNLPGEQRGEKTGMGSSTGNVKTRRKRPRGANWRSSAWYLTSVVALGTATDTLCYNIVVPVLPYRLQSLNYTNISALTSWLMFAYSAGIFVCTFPVAYFFARLPYRRGPLIISVLILEGSLVLFMLAKPYWVMVLSRFLQGAASTVVWTVGFALICENVEEKNMGRQIGFAVAGVSIGTTIAPPIGGALYWHLGWHAPFVFCIIICAVDLIGRLFVIEQKDLKGYEDEASHSGCMDAEKRTLPVRSGADPEATVSAAGNTVLSSSGADNQPIGETADASNAQVALSHTASLSHPSPEKELSPWGVLLALISNPRGINGFISTFVFGLVLGALDPTLTLRVQSVWDKNSDFVGLVYLAASAPSFVTGPLIGALADKVGAEWIMFPSLALAAPWVPLMILKSSLPGFIIFFALANTMLNCSLGPVGLEVALAARQVEGMSEIHQFAAMNLAFSMSTAIGAVAGGQIYDHVPNGWAAVCWFCFATVIAAIPFPFFWAGNRPLFQRLRGRFAGRKDRIDGESREEGPSQEA